MSVPSDDQPRGPTDLVPYVAAREMLTNVVKHAGAQSVSIELDRTEQLVSVTVTDDGSGIADDALERPLAAGHIGIASHRLRVEAAGGSLTLAPASPHGTVATVRLPVFRRAILSHQPGFVAGLVHRSVEARIHRPRGRLGDPSAGQGGQD